MRRRSCCVTAIQFPWIAVDSSNESRNTTPGPELVCMLERDGTRSMRVTIAATERVRVLIASCLRAVFVCGAKPGEAAGKSVEIAARPTRPR